MHFFQSSVKASTRHSWLMNVCSFFLAILTSVLVFPVYRVNAWQGAGTKIFMASGKFLVSEEMQETFGAGPDIPLSQLEHSYICSLQKALAKDAGDAFVEWLAVEVAIILGRQPAIVTSALKDRAFCAPKQVAAPVKKADVIVHLNTKGVVVSMNPVWNACVSGQNLTLDLIRSNADTFVHRQGTISKEFAMTCRDYHRGDVSMWQHPDYPGLEIQLDDKGRLIGGLPRGFTAKKETVQKNLVRQ